MLAYGFSTTRTSKSRLAGSVSAIRIRPLLSSRLYAAALLIERRDRRGRTVRTVVQSKHRVVALVALNTAWICGGVIVMAADG